MAAPNSGPTFELKARSINSRRILIRRSKRKPASKPSSRCNRSWMHWM